MAEPATTSPRAAGVAERGVLLTTKLHIPRPRPGFLAVRGCWSNWQPERHAS
jgi:hypothetical protein